MGYKTGQIFFLLLGPIGPSLCSMDQALKNLSLKTTQHHFGSGRHLDQIQLSSTKPNIPHKASLDVIVFNKKT